MYHFTTLVGHPVNLVKIVSLVYIINNARIETIAKSFHVCIKFLGYKINFLYIVSVVHFALIASIDYIAAKRHYIIYAFRYILAIQRGCVHIICCEPDRTNI